MMRFTRAMLDGHAAFDDDGLAFTLESLPPIIDSGGEAAAEEIRFGRYELPRRSEEAYVYRLQHPLAQSLLRGAQQATPAPATLHQDYSAHGAKVTVLETLKGGEGTVSVQRLRVHSLGATEEYLLAAATSPMHVLDADTTEKLLALPGRAVPLPRADAFGAAMPLLPPSLQQALAQQRAAV